MNEEKWRMLGYLVRVLVLGAVMAGFALGFYSLIQILAP